MEITELRVIQNDEIEEISNILKIISDNFGCEKFMVFNKKKIFRLSGEQIESSLNTLITIDGCIRNGFYSDVFYLIRKIRDDLMQCLFLIDVVINGYEDNEELELCDINDGGKFNELVLAEFVDRITGKKCLKNQEVLESWFFNTLDKNSSIRRKYFDTSKYKNYLKGDKKIDYMITTFLQTDWDKIDRVLNNYVHANGIKYIVQNYDSYSRRQENKKTAIELLQQIGVIFISILSMLDGTLLKALDYEMALDMGEIPVEGSQYWVASGITDFMKKYCDKNLLQYINNENLYKMQFIENEISGE